MKPTTHWIKEPKPTNPFEPEPFAVLTHWDIDEIQRDARDDLRAKLDAAKRQVDRLDEQLGFNVHRAGELANKLKAVEKACAAVRQIILELQIEDRLPPSAIKTAAMLESALSDAGRDYVPKAEAEQAWRKGMTDAAQIAALPARHLIGQRFSTDEPNVCELRNEISTNILAARDAIRAELLENDYVPKLPAIEAAEGAVVTLEAWAESLGKEPTNNDNYCRLKDWLRDAKKESAT